MPQFLVALLLFLSPFVYGQSLLDKKITVKFSNYPIEKCLNHIQKNSGITFSYNSKQIGNSKKKIKKSFENEPLRIILDYVLFDTKLHYKEIGSQITIYELNSSAETFVISGYVQDKNSGENLVGARVYFPDYSIGCIANSYGYYALEIPKGLAKMRVNSLGMLTLRQEIFMEQDLVFNIEMDLDTIVLGVVEIRTDSVKKDKPVADLPRLDQTLITQTAISKVPAAGGESDLLRHLQQLPGVQPANDGGANFQVRGSGTGGNLILIDEIPIYHPTHLLGIYSIINTDALKSATLYKDYIPLQYGTRSSSVLRIYTKEGNLNKPHISGGLSGFMARIAVEGPIVKKKASFYFSARRSTFPGELIYILNKKKLGDPTFYDLNGKLNFKLNSNNRIYFTGYFGRDELRDTVSEYKWGNLAGSFRWNHIVNTKTFSNLIIVHSEFSYGFKRFSASNALSFGQRVITDKINYDFTNFLNGTTKINYGISSAFLRTSKDAFKEKDANLFLKRQSFENGVYASVEKRFSRKFHIKGGIRIPISFHLGTGDTTSYLNSNFSQTQVIYKKNKFYDPIFFADPRLVGTYRISEKDEFQFAAMITSQNTHIVTYINYFLPIEIWAPSTSYLKPERNFQMSVGWVHNWKNLHTSAIVYNKFVRNVLDYASPVFTSSVDIESNLLAGKLHVYGAELMANYKFTTWYSASVSYAYTKTQQKIKGINNDLPYLAPSDRPHYFSFSQYFYLSKKWKITTNYIMHTGTAINLPNGQFTVGGTAFPLYSSIRNNERFPIYKRLDLSFKRQLGYKKNKTNWDLAFTITNFFNRNNPSVAFVEHEPNAPNKLIIQTINYAPLMISINLNFHY